jgi:hypothetical protein
MFYFTQGYGLFFSQRRRRACREEKGWMMKMSLPLCTICEGFRDDDGSLFCNLFPNGIPSGKYPSGCTLKGSDQREPANGFKPKLGMEEITRRWAELF